MTNSTATTKTTKSTKTSKPRGQEREAKWTKRSPLFKLLAAVKRANGAKDSRGYTRAKETGSVVNAVLTAVLQKASPETLQALTVDCGAESTEAKLLGTVLKARTDAATAEVKAPKTVKAWEALLAQAPPEVLAKFAAA